MISKKACVVRAFMIKYIKCVFGGDSRDGCTGAFLLIYYWYIYC